MHRPEDFYHQWIQLYDQGQPDQAMELTTPDFVMLTPDGRTLSRADAVDFVAQIKAYVQQLGLKRQTKIESLHVQLLPQDQHLIHARVLLTFTTPDGTQNQLPFVEVLQVTKAGICFDAFAKLAQSQSFF